MEFKKFFVYPKIPKELEKWVAISNNLWFSWDYRALSLFYKIDANLFRLVKRNPVKFIHFLPKGKLESLTEDRRFLMDLEEVWERFEEYKKRESILKEYLRFSYDDYIAYFCTEFAFHEALPIYAGGLGVLAGDMIIGASDLDLPIVAVGLFYKYGYFKQVIEPSKMQLEEPENIEKFLNLTKEVRDPQGDPFLIEIKILGQPVKVKIWRIEVGKRLCLLLDTDIPENPSEFRDILNYLYAGEPERRIKQEIILGMGGYKALKAVLGREPTIYHLNEGHSAFVILSRFKDLIKEKGLSFEEAKVLIKESTIFTTHTPVISGNEHFDTQLVSKYLASEVEELGIKLEEFLNEGCLPGDKTIFWLPALAIRYTNYINAVSKMHQNTTKKMWHPLFKELLLEEVPIDYVTNGVHWRWLSEPFYDVLEKYLGPYFIYLSSEDSAWDEIFKIPDEEIWEAHRRNKYRLINYIKRFTEERLMKKGFYKAKPELTSKLLKAHHLIISCARRITGYKRNTLILFDEERMIEILKNSAKPVILIFAGKSHPRDLEGKKMIQRILEFREKYDLEDKVLFLENYDIHLARYLIWGSDVWLNTPLKPMEASGTSGMKAGLNGVLHLSVMDGWWIEGFTGENGWAIYPKDGLPPYNYYEANQIYNLLENEIIDLFYERDEEGIPREWVKKMKQTIYNACKYYSINRVLLEYTQKFYKPASENIKFLMENNYENLRKIENERKILLEKWSSINILNVYDNIKEEEVWEGSELEVVVEVDLKGLSPELIEVELVCINEIICIKEAVEEEETITQVEFHPIIFEKYEDNKAIFKTTFPLIGHGLRRFNVRIVPKNRFIRKAYPDLVKWKS